MRNAFIQELMTLAEANDHIALIVGDVGFSVIEPFVERFPDRFVNAGVAEQNMVGLAAGMASEGYHVFVYSIANFPTFRCAEQIRNDVDYHRLPVTIVAVGGGLAYGNLGYSHHAVQDYVLMRVFPNMLIAAPGDPMEVRACLRYLVANPQPSYLRIGKAGEPAIHREVPTLSPGQWVPAAAGTDSRRVLLSTGATLSLALEWATDSDLYRGCAVYSLPLWGMRWKELQPPQVEPFESVTTLEDHLYDGGFGSWMGEALSGAPALSGRLRVRALDAKVCGLVGVQQILNRAGGLVA